MRKLFTYFLLFISVSAYSVQVIRLTPSIDLAPGQSTIISIEIQKEKAEGIASLVDEIPSGFTVQEVNNGGAHFIMEKNQFKLVWMTLPAGQKFTISYKLINQSKVGGDYFIKGKFTYIENDIKKEKIIQTAVIKVGGSGASTILTHQSTHNEEKKQGEEPKKKTHNAQPASPPKKAPEVQQSEKPIATNPPQVNPSTKGYKVQLGVFSKEKDLSIFQNIPNVHYEKVNGLYKYLSGPFSTESEAKNAIEKAVSAGFKGAFLVILK